VRGGVSECREELSKKFLAWLDRNRERIGEKWYKKLLKNFRKANMDSEVRVLAVALWMFNMVCNLGAIGAIGVSFGYKIEKVYNLDRETTEDLLKTISRCLGEMHLLAARKYFVS